jgi:hypothetical protein
VLSKDWRPELMQATEDAGDAIKPPGDGYVSPHDAERLMVVYQNLSEEWADHYANSTYYKENARFKRDAAYNLAFLKSAGKSDRQRDIDAKQDPAVRVGEVVLAEATAALKLAELRYDGSVRGYHAMKKIVEVAHEEKKYL